MVEQTVSELKAHLAAAEEALRRAEIRATVGHLALEMIHEIRNPLEAMNNLTFLARQESDIPEKVRTYLNMAEEQMAHLRYISGKTLRYSQSAFSTEPADLVKVAEAAVRIHQASFTRKHIQLVTDFPEQVIAHIHFGGMLQVMSNLLANSIDAISGAGTIRLRLKAREKHAHILVADNGHGIPSEHIQSIFEPYFTTKGPGGTGLGLALTMKMVKGHRGRIRVRSCVRSGRSGTTFRISVPTNPEG
jgi:signal transduction histidine kinase